MLRCAVSQKPAFGGDTAPNNPLSLARFAAPRSGLEASAARLARPRHARRRMIARAELAFLLLDGLITHAHVDLHGRHVLVPQQLLQAERIAASHQVADRKGMAQNMRAHPPSGEPGPFAQPGEQQGDAVFGEGEPGFRKEEMVFPGVSHSESSSSPGR